MEERLMYVEQVKFQHYESSSDYIGPSTQKYGIKEFLVNTFILFQLITSYYLFRITEDDSVVIRNFVCLGPFVFCTCHKCPMLALLCTRCVLCELYERRLISNAYSEISRKRDHVFKQMKVGSKVQYFSYKLTYLFFNIVALSFNTFFPT